jgi:hypothetical protein
MKTLFEKWLSSMKSGFLSKNGHTFVYRKWFYVLKSGDVVWKGFFD